MILLGSLIDSVFRGRRKGRDVESGDNRDMGGGWDSGTKVLGVCNQGVLMLSSIGDQNIPSS